MYYIYNYLYMPMYIFNITYMHMQYFICIIKSCLYIHICVIL